MDPNADVVGAAIICSTHLNVWPVPEFCSGDMVTKNKETWEYLCSFSLLRWGETTNIRRAQNSSWQGQEGWNAAFNSWHNSPIYDECQTQ